METIIVMKAFPFNFYFLIYDGVLSLRHSLIFFLIAAASDQLIAGDRSFRTRRIKICL